MTHTADGAIYIDSKTKILNDIKQVNQEVSPKVEEALVESATSQFVSGKNIPEEVRANICGLTSMYMVVSTLAKLNLNVGNTNYCSLHLNFEEFLRDGILQTTPTSPYACLREKLGEEITDIPICWNSDLQSLKTQAQTVLKNTHPSKIVYHYENLAQTRVRGFSINTGWDTGGTEKFIDCINSKYSLNIKAAVQSKNPLEVPEELKTLNFAQRTEFLWQNLEYGLINNGFPNHLHTMYTVSVNPANKSWQAWKKSNGISYERTFDYEGHTVQSHVICVLGIKNDLVLFMDPAGRKAEDIILYMPVGEFKKCYNGIHTEFTYQN